MSGGVAAISMVTDECKGSRHTSGVQGRRTFCCSFLPYALRSAFSARTATFSLVIVSASSPFVRWNSSAVCTMGKQTGTGGVVGQIAENCRKYSWTGT